MEEGRGGGQAGVVQESGCAVAAAVARVRGCAVAVAAVAAGSRGEVKARLAAGRAIREDRGVDAVAPV